MCNCGGMMGRNYSALKSGQMGQISQQNINVSNDIATRLGDLLGINATNILAQNQAQYAQAFERTKGIDKEDVFDILEDKLAKGQALTPLEEAEVRKYPEYANAYQQYLAYQRQEKAKKNKKTIFLVLIVLLVIAVVWYFYFRKKE